MSMAIKYAMQKKAKKMAEACQEHGKAGCSMCHGGKMMAEGGMAEHDDDMIGRIMRKRKGEPVAGFEQNDFDYMDEEPVPDDADYTGENSGDMLGNEEEEMHRRDIVSRIMRSRSKKDRLPRPA